MASDWVTEFEKNEGFNFAVTRAEHRQWTPNVE